MIVQIKPTIKQYKAYQYLNPAYKKCKYIGFGGGAGGAKSWLGCEWEIQMCYMYPGTKYFIGRNELKRLMQSTYITFIKVCKHHGIPDEDWHLDGKYNRIIFKNGSMIDLLDVAYLPRDPLYERFGSTEYTSGWLEETGEIDFGAFDVLKSRVGRHMNADYEIPPKILLTCNPKKNWMYQLFYKPWKDGSLNSEYVFIQALVTDNPYVDKAYIENLRSLADESKKQRLLFGNWEYDDDPTKLFDYNAIIAMWSNNHAKTGEKVITVDVARLGEDYTVIFVWDGFQIIHGMRFKKKTLDETDKIIKQFKREWRVMSHNVIVDEDGVGGGLVDFGGYRGFVNNSKAIGNTNYANLKSQCYFEMSKMVNNGEIYIKITDSEIKAILIEDLEQIKDWNSDKDDQKVRVIPKDKIKELIGRSTDCSDSFMMRILPVLVPPPRTSNPRGLM